MIRIIQWLLLTIVAFNGQAWAYDVFSSSYLYEWGFYGLYPTTSFKSSDLTPPLLNFPRWDEERCSDGYYLIAPKGKIVSDPGPAIFDARGDLVWADDSYGVVFNFQVQRYRGEDYLTFWSNPDGSAHGYGRGTYYMLDASYELFRKFEAAGEGLKGDLHEFHLTDRGTALTTVYNPIPADLSAVGGPSRGWALDCLVQEIDVDTGALLFEWSAAAHVPLNATVRAFAGEDDGTTPETAFDFFHLNSIDEDGQGNYILSARHTSTILCIDRDGTILWTLGGRGGGDFTDVSDGRATDFMYQHHVRVHAADADTTATADPTHLLLSIFDNAASERAGLPSPHAQTRGLLVRLDTRSQTASLVRAYADPAHPRRRAASQGSMQVLSDRVVLGYGWLPFITEFSASSAEVLCAVELAPWVAARWGLVNSYRAEKAGRWVGRPREGPAVHLGRGEGRVYVSWNGATEVRRWVLQGAEWEGLQLGHGGEGGEGEGGEDGFVDLDDVPKAAFETALDVTDDMPRYLRVAALDGAGNVMMHSQIIDRHVGNAGSDWVHDVLVWSVVLAVVALGVFILAVRKRGRRAVWGNSTRGYDLIARTAVVCRERVARALAVKEAGIRGGEGEGDGGVYERYPAMRWWRDWGGAKAHELEPVYQD
ncbi:Arylsulfotransferase-domain-containing protein [Hypoxylon argillaceum]|nr:Arylsulfotransferase-domain-containing protein [Hypoxylon argillaceum]